LPSQFALTQFRGADSLDLVLVQHCRAVLLSLSLSIASDLVGLIVGVGAYKEMIRVYAG
jgi:ABC-type microcin C transport system permease subunit YejE